MYLKSVHIWNFRLIEDMEVSFDKVLTLFVGKNNVGKTSFMHIMRQIIDGKKNISFADYPLKCREQMYEAICAYWTHAVKYEDLAGMIPTTKIRFIIDYSDEREDELLGGLSPFIIDLDESKSESIIEGEYQFVGNEAVLDELLNQYQILSLNKKDDKGNKNSKSEENTREEKAKTVRKEGKQKSGSTGCELEIDKKILAQIVETGFDNIFSVVVRAVNPADEKDSQVKNIAFLKELFLLKTIDAERSLDESENASLKPLGTVMNRIFDNDLQEVEENIQDATESLVTYVSNLNSRAQDIVNSLLNDIVGSMLQFGYPTAEDLKLQANTKISLKNEIIKNTDLAYISDSENESLPSSHNGLGYKNLIKITFLLQEFARAVKGKAQASIPVLILEEPEAHMHPQLQAVFVRHLENVLRRFVGNTIQIILTTHSSHIANTVPFSQVRYMRRHKQRVICKNLWDFYQNAQKTEDSKIDVEFLQKYLTISRCDLYFCDKAILVEGAAERLLVPDMIKKCSAKGLFSGANPTLLSQYCSIIEVGGAYAHRFFGFVDFLEIPTLILTDIDFVDSNGAKCQKTKAVRSSNGTIGRWCHDMYNIAISTTIKISDILKLAEENDKKTNGLRHIEFQLQEGNCHPRSLEEAIINVNRNLFGQSDDETEITFSDDDGKKTDFAIRLLVEPELVDYEIPSYIKNGLIWLNGQSKMPKAKQPLKKLKRQRKNLKKGDV